jgi:hypothetical protein
VISLLYPHLTLLLNACQQYIRRWVKPTNQTLLANAALDLTRSKTEIILEEALLRQQLIVLERQVKRPVLKPRERMLLVLLASQLEAWKQALLIVQPDTLLRWHRDIFRWLWKRKSRPKQRPGRRPLLGSVVALIQQMARENRTWGADSGRTAEAGAARGEEHDPEVHQAGAQASAVWAVLACLPAQPRF